MIGFREDTTERYLWAARALYAIGVIMVGCAAYTLLGWPGVVAVCGVACCCLARMMEDLA